jgi:hypothetical protein
MRVLSVLLVAVIVIASTANAETSDKAPALRGLQAASSDTHPERNLQFIDPSVFKHDTPRPRCRPEDRCRGRD